MRIMNFMFLCIILSSLGCKSIEHTNSDLCAGYNKLLTEFALKVEPYKNKCYTYSFAEDKAAYIDYNEFGGKTKFMDFRLNEVLFYQHNLTNEFLDLSQNSKECLSHYSKRDIINLFGAPTIENKIYDYFKYYIVTEESCEYCTGEKSDISFCANTIQFNFKDENQNCSDILISIFQLN